MPQKIFSWKCFIKYIAVLFSLLLTWFSFPGFSCIFCGTFLSFIVFGWWTYTRGSFDEKEKPTDNWVFYNPFKKLRNRPLSEDQQNDVFRKITEFVTYDAQAARSLDNFKVVQDNTECLFAKKAITWGSRDWDDSLTLEQNIELLVPTFYQFCLECQSRALDGFALELPGPDYCYDEKSFGEAVRRSLCVLSSRDPTGWDCMKKSYIARKSWVFRFAKVTFFVTTFAPFYTSDHSRYAFGAENGYVLLQPEISFARHDLPDDTGETNWESPRTVRDKIRCRFRDVGRDYMNRKTPHMRIPLVWDMVKPADPSQEYYDWWSGDKVGKENVEEGKQT